MRYRPVFGVDELNFPFWNSSRRNGAGYDGDDNQGRDKTLGAKLQSHECLAVDGLYFFMP